MLVANLWEKSHGELSAVWMSAAGQVISKNVALTSNILASDNWGEISALL